MTQTGSLAPVGAAGAAPPRGGRVPSGAWVLAASALAGLAVFGYLSLANRFLDPAAQDHFAVYYSLSLLLGFGAFLPLEAELARTLGARRDVRAGLREAAVVAAGVALLVAALVLALGVPLLGLLGGSGWLLAATVAVVAVSAVQFWVRGALLGLGRPGAFAATLALDSVLRLAVAAALVLLVGTRTAPLFTLSLLLPLLLAHGAFVPAVLRAGSRAPAGAGSRVDAPDRLRPLGLARRLLPLFVATACAQVLLNAPVLLVEATAEQGETAAFLFAFSLARVPLFMAVPVQGAVVPPMAAMVAAGRTHAVVTAVLRLAAGLVGLAAVGGVVAAAAGPAVLGALFPTAGSPPRPDLALMVVGVAANIGLLLTAQANVAAANHRASGLAWGCALLVAAAAWALAGTAGAGPLLRVEIAFAAGSALGWALAVALLLRHAGPAGHHRTADADRAEDPA